MKRKAKRQRLAEDESESIATVFDLLKTSHDAIDSQTIDLLHSRMELDKLNGRVERLQRDLNQTQKAIKATSAAIVRLESGLVVVQNEAKILRHWGEQMQMKDLPEELLVEVLQCVEFVDQRRLHRVNKRWNTVLEFADISKVVLINAADLVDSESKLVRELVVDPSPTGKPFWKPRGPTRWSFKYGKSCEVLLALKQLSGDPSRSYSGGSFKTAVSALGRRFIKVTALRVYQNNVASSPDMIDWYRLGFGSGNTPVFIEEYYERAVSGIDGRDDLRTSDTFYLKIAGRDQSTETSHKFYDRINDAIWPYPEEQLRWLFKAAPLLNDHVNDIVGFRKALPFQECTCDQPDCEHFFSFRCRLPYPRWWNLMALYLLRLNDPAMTPPPYSFDRVEKYVLDSAGKPRRILQLGDRL